MTHGFEVEKKNPPSPLSRGIFYSENLLTSLALAAMMLLPVAEIFLRKFFQTGISGVTVIVQHLVLLVGMIGGILAARDQRLLSLSTLSSFLNKRWTGYAKIGANSFATAITVFLCVGSFQFAQSSHRFGKVLIFDIPTWTVQAILPVAFAIIALRLWWTSSEGWKGRIATVVLSSGAILLGIFPPASPESLVIPCLIGMGIAAILGAPIFTLLGGAALILFWGEESPIASIALDHYQMVVNPSLATIPLFTLAGYFLAEGGASKRLIRVFLSLVGQIRGGPVIVTTLVCAFFTTFTGASGVTILALGGLLLPVLIAANFSERNAIGLLTGAGSLGVLFPPCLPLILYAVIATNSGAHVEIKDIFLGGLLPGTLLVGLTVWWGVTKAKPANGEIKKERFNAKEAYKATWEAKWELLLPVVALVSLFGGFATPVEAAALTALYALCIEVFIYKDLHLLRDVPRVMAECGLLVGGVLLILGVAMGFTNYLIDAQIPDLAVDWATSTITSKWVFLLLLNVFLLLVGCLMDIFSAIIVVVPLLIPIGLAFGIDPVHLGIIFLANLQLGYLTPPVGMNLFLSSYRFGKPLPEIIRATMPMLLVFLVSILLITYLPFLTTWLPSVFK
jgi:tripartite ATP-independent transporter DctM subunit